MSLLQAEMNAALYDAHPYGRDIIGHKEEIAELTTEDALDFYNRFYTPNNATLIVAGDIGLDELRPLAEKYYGSIAQRAPTFERERAPVVWPDADRRVVRRDDRVQEPTWLRFYPAPDYASAGAREGAAFDVLAEILGGGQTSRLYRNLVITQGIAASIGAWYEGSRLDAGKFGLYALPRVGGPLADLEKAVDAEIAALLAEGVTDEELERAKTVIAAGAVYARDSQRSMAYAYGEGLMTGMSVADIHEWPDRIRAVTADDVVDAARSVLSGSVSVTGELLPGDGA
jgi:zinc protease